MTNRVTPEGATYPAAYHETELVDGVLRYKRNRIVDDLLANDPSFLHYATIGVAQGRYSPEEHAELLRLVGYSLAVFAGVTADADLAVGPPAPRMAASWHEVPLGSLARAADGTWVARSSAGAVSIVRSGPGRAWRSADPGSDLTTDDLQADAGRAWPSLPFADVEDLVGLGEQLASHQYPLPAVVVGPLRDDATAEEVEVLASAVAAYLPAVCP